MNKDTTEEFDDEINTSDVYRVANATLKNKPLEMKITRELHKHTAAESQFDDTIIDEYMIHLTYESVVCVVYCRYDYPAYYYADAVQSGNGDECLKHFVEPIVKRLEMLNLVMGKMKPIGMIVIDLYDNILYDGHIFRADTSVSIQKPNH